MITRAVKVSSKHEQKVSKTVIPVIFIVKMWRWQGQGTGRLGMNVWRMI
jgi:hypothetical protein